MDDRQSDSLETSLRKFKIRQAEIAKEIRDDITEMHYDLTKIVSEFTSVLTEKTEIEVTFTSCRISDIELQLRRLEETKSMISSFAGIFQQFNTMTSKILATDSNVTYQEPSSQVKASFMTETVENGLETTQPILHEQSRLGRSSYVSDDDVLSRGSSEPHLGSAFGNEESDMIVTSADKLPESLSKKRNYMNVSGPDRVYNVKKQNGATEAHLTD